MRLSACIAFIAAQLWADLGCAHAGSKVPPGFHPLLAQPHGPAGWQPPPGTAAATVAVKIDDRYLLTTTAGMPERVRDFRADPTVFIHDGERWQRGRYVDYHPSFGLALVRTDEPFPGPKVEVAGVVSDFAVQIALDEAAPATLRRLRVSPRRLHPPESGALYIDESDRIIYVVGRSIAAHGAERGGGAVIADFLQTYFLTGGLEVDPKPAFCRNEKPPPDGGGSVPQP